jgi:hypothetical protein
LFYIPYPKVKAKICRKALEMFIEENKKLNLSDEEADSSLMHEAETT